MFEELGELLLGPWGIAAVLFFGASATNEGRHTLRKVAKGAIRLGYEVADKGSVLLEEVKEQMSDIVEEVKSEQAEGNGSVKTARKISKKAD